MQIEWRKIKDLKPYEKNPRKNKDAIDYVANSIKEFGFKVPIVIDSDGVIVAGHTRYEASKKLKLKEVPVIVADDLSEEQVKAFRLADNKTAEIAEWDLDLLADELDEILNIDMADFGFDLEEDDMDGEIIEDDVPENAETRCSPGDIWKLGNNRLICGDSTDMDVVEKLMAGEQADLFLTDPPYNVDYEGKTKDRLKIQNDQMESSNFKAFLMEAFSNANNVMKKGAVYYIWHADSEGYNFRSACDEVGWTVRQCLIWNKNSMVMGRQDYQWKHEPCLYGGKDGAAHKWCSDRKQTTVLDFNRPTRSEMHPTMKPLDLIGYQIKNSSEKNDLVLDLFGGSGSTLIACEQLDRICYMAELDPHYCDIIIQRWENLTGGTAELLTE